MDEGLATRHRLSGKHKLYGPVKTLCIQREVDRDPGPARSTQLEHCRAFSACRRMLAREALCERYDRSYEVMKPEPLGFTNVRAVLHVLVTSESCEQRGTPTFPC